MFKHILSRRDILHKNLPNWYIIAIHSNPHLAFHWVPEGFKIYIYSQCFYDIKYLIHKDCYKFWNIYSYWDVLRVKHVSLGKLIQNTKVFTTAYQWMRKS